MFTTLPDVLIPCSNIYGTPNAQFKHDTFLGAKHKLLLKLNTYVIRRNRINGKL